MGPKIASAVLSRCASTASVVFPEPRAEPRMVEIGSRLGERSDRVELRHRAEAEPAICGKTNHIQWLSFAPRFSSTSACGYTPSCAATNRSEVVLQYRNFSLQILDPTVSTCPAILLRVLVAALPDSTGVRACFGFLGAVPERRLPGSHAEPSPHHGGADIGGSRRAVGKRPAVAVMAHRSAFETAGAHEQRQLAPRHQPAGPRGPLPSRRTGPIRARHNQRA